MKCGIAVFVSVAGIIVCLAHALAYETGVPGEPGKGAIVEVGPAETVVLPEPSTSPVRAKRPKPIGWPSGRTPTVLPGFRLTEFAGNLDRPRWLYVLPNGDVLVCESRTSLAPQPPPANRITLFRPDQDGNVKVREVFLTGLNQPMGMWLLGDRFYVANTDALLVFPYQAGQTRITEPGKKVTDWPGGMAHWPRILLAKPDGSKLYVTVGSSSDYDQNGRAIKEPNRAAILEMNPDGSAVRVFASGLRSPVGMDWEPTTNTLWTVVNEGGRMGDQLPPDFFTSLHDGDFFGWPDYYWGGRKSPLKREIPPNLPKVVTPDYALGAHVAPLGLLFYRGKSFPQQYHGGAFIAEHGSAVRSNLVGYKVVYVPFINGRPHGLPQDFLTGFLANDQTGEVYGRPVGLAMLRDGSLLVADDAGGKIWRISATKTSPPPRPQ